jgi:hypothetical protein
MKRKTLAVGGDKEQQCIEETWDDIDGDRKRKRDNHLHVKPKGWCGANRVNKENFLVTWGIVNVEIPIIYSVDDGACTGLVATEGMSES